MEQIRKEIASIQESQVNIETMQARESNRLLELDQKWLNTKHQRKQARIYRENIIKFDQIKRQLTDYQDMLVDLKSKLPDPPTQSE